jgi:Flp pilus assembly pilin Flp
MVLDNKTVLRDILRFFRRNDQGQDLSEYCLLTALVALLAAGIFVYASGGIGAVWGSSSSSLATAGAAASGAAGSTAGTAAH